MDISESLATLLLTNRLVEVGAEPFSAKQFWLLRSAVGDVSQLVGKSADDITNSFGVEIETARRAEALLQAVMSFSLARVQIEGTGIRVCSYLDEQYPQRLRTTLGDRAPIFVMMAGNDRLLEGDSRGIVGSRSVGADSIEVAEIAARRAVKRGDTVVSGLAKGIDQTAMAAALAEDVGIIGIPTEGLGRVSQNPQIRALVAEGRICLINPYGPDVGFSVGTAMGRNKLIYGLAKSTLVVTSDLETGGTWAGAIEALRGEFAQVDVWLGAGQGKGNEALVAKGARPVRDVEELWQDSATSHAPRHSKAEQMQLGFDDNERSR